MSADGDAGVTEVEELNADEHVKQFIRFRNPDSLPAVITQMFLIVAAMIVVLGLAYVIATIILITIHNFCYDRDAKKVPDFVKRSAQFSSEYEDESDQEFHLNVVDLLKRRRVSDVSITPEQMENWMKSPSVSKKNELLEKFLMDTHEHHTPRKD